MVKRVGLLPLARNAPTHQRGVKPGLRPRVWHQLQWCGTRLHPIHAATPAPLTEAPRTRHPCLWIFSAPSSSLFKLSHPVSGLTANLAVTISETSTGEICILTLVPCPSSWVLLRPLGRWSPVLWSFCPFVTVLAPVRPAWPHRGHMVWT